MADNPPYLNAYGQIPKILDKIKTAKTPDRFTNDFLYTKLAFKSKSLRPFVPLAKRLGLLNEDGSPTSLYKAFRSTNGKTSFAAMATAIKTGYSELYSRNEYAHNLDKNDLKGLVIEVTGLESDNQIVGSTVSTFEALKPYADFDAEIGATDPDDDENGGADDNGDDLPDVQDIKMGLSYTINLVLPKTDDISVFNAIFKSLRENLLRK